jgi:hypothetical protein
MPMAVVPLVVNETRLRLPGASSVSRAASSMAGSQV